MDTAKIERIIDPKRSAKVEYDEYGAHLHTMNNGFQWSGAAIYSVEVAEAAIEVLQGYVKLMKEAQEDITDNRPEDCRERLRETGQAHPRSGCRTCVDWLKRGCVYEC